MTCGVPHLCQFIHNQSWVLLLLKMFEMFFEVIVLFSFLVYCYFKLWFGGGKDVLSLKRFLNLMIVVNCLKNLGRVFYFGIESSKDFFMDLVAPRSLSNCQTVLWHVIFCIANSIMSTLTHFRPVSPYHRFPDVFRRYRNVTLE